MPLTEAIVNLGQRLITPENHWYTWPVDDAFLPEGITLPSGCPYNRGVALKQQLNQRLKNANDEERVTLVRYYIVVWGRIKRNKPEKLRNYALQAPAELIALGKKGIASWSKALSIRDPNGYAIYDARVAVALNALQIINNVVQPQLFPLLAGQNRLIKRASDRLPRYAAQHHWTRLNVQEFYCRYIQVISTAAVNLASSLYTVEMLLFAKAEDLYRKAFPNEQF